MTFAHRVQYRVHRLIIALACPLSTLFRLVASFIYHSFRLADRSMQLKSLFCRFNLHNVYASMRACSHACVYVLLTHSYTTITNPPKSGKTVYVVMEITTNRFIHFYLFSIFITFCNRKKMSAFVHDTKAKAKAKQKQNSGFTGNLLTNFHAGHLIRFSYLCVCLEGATI